MHGCYNFFQGVSCWSLHDEIGVKKLDASFFKKSNKINIKKTVNKSSTNLESKVFNKIKMKLLFFAIKKNK